MPKRNPTDRFELHYGHGKSSPARSKETLRGLGDTETAARAYGIQWQNLCAGMKRAGWWMVWDAARDKMVQMRRWDGKGKIEDRGPK